MTLRQLCISAVLAACGGAMSAPAFAQQGVFEFSLDIGSDTELSDPMMDGDEVFDPGDVYLWQGPPFLGPANGFKNDASLFGFDYAPTPGGSAAPVCLPGQSIQNYVEFFDVDGHDQIDVPLQQFIPPPPDDADPQGGQPAADPIPIFNSNCIHKLEFMMLSFDDDGGVGWVGCDVPVTAPSPGGVASYGSSATRDEIVGLNLTPGFAPYGVVSIYPIADEATVHPNLAPNPDSGLQDDPDDDDVDSLDLVRNPDQCPYWLWSPDHEGRAIGSTGAPLDPGGIYQRSLAGAGYAKVIDEAIHLGISEEADIDAFELAFIETQQFGGPVLALIFSVDDNDPLTPGDESGGLNPRMLYASFMTGASFPILVDPLEDDIDAITVFAEPFQPDLEACCFPDGSCADLTVADCLAAGGAPQGPGTNCATVPCPLPLEACCYPDGTCADLAVADCLATGGTPQGPGTTCATVTCPQPLEACCYPDGTCADLTVADCIATGGAPQGPGTDCTTVNCPQPLEACCYTDGTCADLTVADCIATGGTPQGPGTDCTTVNCPQPVTEACCFTDGSCADLTVADCLTAGGAPQGPGTTCATVICDCPEPRIEFSIDLGSDAELSDPNADGDEVFDPGDVYLWQSPALLGPANGFKDDATIFGSDIAPTPFGALAPICQPGQSIQNYVEFFDLDGHDQLDVNLIDIIPTQPGTADLVQQFPSSCIFRPEFLAVTFDDDRGLGWVGCDVPVTALSAAGLRHGTTPIQDEIEGLVLGGGAFPFNVINRYGIASERQVHVNLRPDPDTSEDTDDDVDSLDAVVNPDLCPFWYFTADHEARSINPLTGAPMDAGDIYLQTGFGPITVVDDVIHLGLSDETDIDGFEFAWVLDPQGTGALVLGVIFSVDNDDPLTAINESGGLNPRMLYYSALNGVSLPLLNQPLNDDIDGVTIWCRQIAPLPPCPGDANGDQAVDFNDLNLVLSNWGTVVVPGTDGDVNGDGFIDFNDLNLVLGNWGTTCP